MRIVALIGAVAWAFLSYRLAMRFGFPAGAGVTACALLSIQMAYRAIEDKP